MPCIEVGKFVECSYVRTALEGGKIVVVHVMQTNLAFLVLVDSVMVGGISGFDSSLEGRAVGCDCGSHFPHATTPLCQWHSHVGGMTLPYPTRLWCCSGSYAW
jgi:hypothetical protein